jgi:pilus assembly protein CpaE
MSSVVALSQKSSDSGLDAAKIGKIVAFAIDPEIIQVISDALPGIAILEGGLQSAITVMSQQESSDILIVDFADIAEPVAALRSLRNVCGAATKIVGIGAINDIHLLHALIDAGASDYLAKPVSSLELSTVIGRINTTPEEKPETKTSECGTIFVTGARGGAGASSFVTAAAWHFAESSGQTTTVVDLDLIFGSIALAFDLEASHGLRDILENPDRVDSLFVASALAKVTKNLSVMAAEEDLDNPPELRAGAMELLIEELEAGNNNILVDIPSNVLANDPRLISRAKQLVILSEMNLAAVRDVLRIMRFVKDSGYDIPITVVANKVSVKDKSELTKKEFEQAVGVRIKHVLPWDPKVLAEAAKLGQTVTQLAPKSPISRAIIDVATALNGSHQKKSKTPSLWSRFSRKA